MPRPTRPPMHRYVVSFRVGADPGSESRRDSLLRELARLPRHWTDGTALAVVEAEEPDAMGLERRLYYGSELESAFDRLLVLALPTDGGGAIRGPADGGDALASLVPALVVA